MTQHQKTMIAIDQAEIEALHSKIDALHQAISQVNMTPRAQWVPVAEYAKMRGKTARTIRNWIRAGHIETKREGSVTLVKVG